MGGMTIGAEKEKVAERIRFSWMEFSGSLGDLGLFIPLVVSMTIACGLDIGVVLILAGLMNVATGYLFRQPIPVQPMKAMAAVVIAEGLSHHELAAAGMAMGAVLLVLSFFTDKITRFVPKAIVRGIQLGVGVKLAVNGLSYLQGLPFWGIDSVSVAVLLTGILIVSFRSKQPVLLYVFLAGFLVQYVRFPEAFSTIQITLPHFRFYWPYPSAWVSGFLKGALPQIPLTLLNSVVAVCALSADYFPGQGIPPKKMAASVGWMNLICVPLGGIPMCHGAGGLAAQYRFGARTGGSVIILGVLKIAAGFIFGGALLGLLRTYPMTVLGPMLIFAGIELSKSSGDAFKRPLDAMICLVTAGCIVAFNAFTGFFVGSLTAFACHIYSWGRGKIYAL